MNPESLIGTVLGTCTLQKVVGQGGMGAVFLAQQSRPRRSVAIKVLLPATSLTPTQKMAFLERFRRETDAAALLEHPNISPVYEYGEQEGLAYLVMPYISGGTLRDLMEEEGQLPLPKALKYLDQLAEALDFAHKRGVIHRDIKPANILMTLDERLLLTDFGLVKIVVGGQEPQLRLTGAGAPVGTPDYMSPEQVIGDPVDGRSDQYSLGIILYQMLTATTPFQGETPMQIAAQQLQTLPPPPRLARPDLPFEIEHVILKAMAKRPDERYPTCKAFAQAFRNALSRTDLRASMHSTAILPAESSTDGRLFTPKSLFDPAWRLEQKEQTGQVGVLPKPMYEHDLGGLTETSPVAEVPAGRSSGLLSRTGMFPTVGKKTEQLATGITNNLTATPDRTAPTTTVTHSAIVPPLLGKLPMATGALTTVAGTQSAMAYGGVIGQIQQFSPTFPVPARASALLLPTDEQTAANLMTMTGSIKAVRVPIAGQLGKYVAGFLSTIPQAGSVLPKLSLKKRLGITLLALLAVLLVLSSLLYWYFHTGIGPAHRKISGTQMDTLNGNATLTAQTNTTAGANILFSDPLRQNIHNWPENTNEFFAHGAYHIVDTDTNGVAVPLVSLKPFTVPFVYSLTMQEIKGNDAVNNNTWGMILDFNWGTKNGRTVMTFYSFEVSNTRGGWYQFSRYDNSKNSTNPWTPLWSHPFGAEFHQGQGPKYSNMFNVSENGSTFSFTVNGTYIAAIHDSTLKFGNVGMLINLKGTEVAFTNMLITHKGV
ncbi:MAG: serine/threonine protein kinase [Chloroflexota bacterium]|nr:serine/threonine protein kinase [Chloroflexota bacterium]